MFLQVHVEVSGKEAGERKEGKEGGKGGRGGNEECNKELPHTLSACDL